MAKQETPDERWEVTWSNVNPDGHAGKPQPGPDGKTPTDWEPFACSKADPAVGHPFGVLMWWRRRVR